MKQLLFGLVAVFLIAAAPAPIGHINDFANIIPDDREAALEQSLQTYEAQTEIEIAVVTTPTLDGKEIEEYSIDLARAWGVGKKGANNGVLVVIAPNDRKYRIEVGYGLEGDLTDADSGTLATDTLVPAFKAGDYPGGIERLTQALTSHLGVMSPEQRAEARRKMEEAAEKEYKTHRAALFSFLGWLTSMILVLTGLYISIRLFRSMREAQRTKARNTQRRTALHEYLKSIDAIPDGLMQAVDALDLPNLPAWMQDDKERYQFALEAALEKAGQFRKEMISLIEVDIDQAEALQLRCEQWLKKAKANLEKLRSIPDQVQRLRLECEQAVQQVVVEIDDLLSQVAVLTKKRYRVAELVPSLDVNRLQDEKQNITTLLNERGEGLLDASGVVHDKATRLLRKVRTLKERLESVIKMQLTSQRRIIALKKRVNTLPALLAEHQLRLERLRTIAPKARFISFVEGLPVFERTLNGIAPRLSAAIRDNSMKVQLFAEAVKILDAAEANLLSVYDTVNQAKQLERSVNEAKQQFASIQKRVKRAIADADWLTRDGDVGKGAKNRLLEAERILERATVDSVMPDWIGITALLNQANAKATQAVELAHSDIDAAERERHQQAQEEERRRKRAAAAQNNNQHSSGFGTGDSPTVGSFGGFGSSDFGSGSSSGSFGGGDFGGGGSSGSW